MPTMPTMPTTPTPTSLRQRIRKTALYALRLTLGLALLTVVVIGGLRLWIEARMRERVYARIEDLPHRPVALVLGAGLWPDGSLTAVLADRVATAADLYHAGVVDTLLLSGDNRFVDYNEPAAMQAYARRLGVPDEALVLDYAGRRTYDSCYRARHIFGVREAIVVTQRFHAARALYLCDAVGVEAVVILADRQPYSRRRIIWETREYLAVVLAWWDVHVRHPVPVLGPPLPISSPQFPES